MHGRIKTRTTAEQEEIKRKERAKKVELYKAGIKAVFDKRHKAEKDEEALAVSAKLLTGNPDIYTLWNIRREVILHLKTCRSEEELDPLMHEELRLTEACLRTQPKSYGTWHHRCWVLDHMTDPPWKKELALCDKYLDYDERNFHCWDYRRFIVQRSGVTAEDELRFTDEKIATNFSNYSAWHLRSNLLPQVYPDPKGLKPIEDHQHQHEMELVTNAAFTDPLDQSAWFYQRWLLGRHVPQLKITHVIATKEIMCVAFDQSLNPASRNVMVKAFGNEGWQTVDGEVSAFVWKRVFLEEASMSDLTSQPIVLHLDGVETQVVTLQADKDQAWYKEKPVYEAGFSHGVTEVLCGVLESCETLLQLEPDTKWPLLTSVLLMQAVDRKSFKEQTLEYLDKLVKIDRLRANYYLDLKSRYLMEYQLEEWNLTGSFSVANLGLTALYHSQYLLLAQKVDLTGNLLSRSLPKLSSLQFCQELILDKNNLNNLKGFPCLPNLVTLSIKMNHISALEDIEPHITSCCVLTNVFIDGNPLSASYVFSNGAFKSK
ncbi:geranylgeranyl transferase type-2 subunit alpha [Macrosteles quadrilineatus]|uniref:geranylgeranyl transferase type-2 subunit alpha n=1 Tax=Macrosteles quadrilineatus TaxID=74068 RepID=UPI0023E292CD|nr:geranylgeranyl transferase type-2 subunit alpha [Macrosteles quadrilineatus]